MDCETYSRSRLYFSRYRVLHDLRTLATIDPTSTSLAERTPEWFTSKYIEHLAYPEHSKEVRLIFQPGDRDIDPEFNDGRLVPGHRHILRHISRAEVRSLLAMHARWLVEDQKLQKQNKVFDPSVWGSWLPECQKYRAASHEQGFSWGVFWGGKDPFEENEETFVSDDSEDDMEVDEPVPPPSAMNKAGRKQIPRIVCPPFFLFIAIAI